VPDHRPVRPAAWRGGQIGESTTDRTPLRWRRSDAARQRICAGRHPTAAQLQEQLTAELAASLAHLSWVEAGFWERDWRSAHRGLGAYPENHLWDAVYGYLDLLNATQTGQREIHT